jgi:hypothetical protein
MTAPPVTPLREPAETAIIPPSAIESEQALLGALLINNTAYHAAAGRVGAKDFYQAVYGRIFAAIGKLIERGQVADWRTLGPLFDQDEALKAAGGSQHLRDLACNAITVLGVPDYADLIADTARRRRLIELGQQLIENAAHVELGQTAEQILSAFQDQAQAALAATNSWDRGGSIWVDDEAWSEAELPARPWVATGYALRGAVSLVVGAPSALKSSLMLAWGCAVALGRSHGKFMPAAPGNALIYNVEDDADEQRRRLSAVLRQFGVGATEIAGKLTRVGAARVGTLFRIGDDGILSTTAAMQSLRSLIAQRRPDLLIADPLAELHSVEENDNTSLRKVIAEFRAIAVEFGIAVILVHHTRKGAMIPGDPDAARGASATIGAARIVLTLVTMSEQDAETFGLATSRQARSRYVRLDDAKQNYAAIGKAEWYEKTLHRLDNGETVAAATPWQPPDIWGSVTSFAANRILDRLDAGLGNGKRYSVAPQAKDRAAWPIVIDEVPSLTEEQAKKIIKTWLNNGVIEVRDYPDPGGQRHQRKGMFVNPAKRPS